METRSARRQAGNLPADLTSFVGRRTDIADVKALLATTRLVSLIGPGGVGKTRLVLKVAAELRRAFADGVWIAELADVRDADCLAGTIAGALRIPTAPGLTTAETLASELRDRRMLLVLDNCEQVLDGCATLATELLKAAPHLRMLTTSRQPLRVSGELISMVAPLEVPDPRLPLTPGAATQYAAMALFVERARAVVPDFVLTSENELAVAQLCQRLEGIPLAIELAAVSLRVLSVQEVAERLDRRFEVLTSGPRTAPERHQTLEATVMWSYELCTPREQALWARCAVFAGHFDRAAVAAICSDEDVPVADALGVLAGLVDKSVLAREEVDQTVRFAMSETNRQYGLARLAEAGGTDVVGRKHLDYYAALVHRAAQHAFGRAQGRWLLALQRDHANIRGALDRAMVGPVEAHQALDLASTAWFYWIACGQLLEGRHWLDRALFADTAPTAARARALWVNALLVVLQGDRVVADELVEDALRAAREVGDPEAEACATHVRGVAALLAGDLGRAISQFDDAQRAYEANGQVDGLPVLLGVHRGLAHLFDGDRATATTIVEQCRALCQARGERWVLSYAVQVAALIEFLRDDQPTCAALAAESLVAKRELGDTLGIAVGLDLMGWSAAAEGQFVRAAALLGASHRVWDSVGEPVFGSKSFATLRSRAEETIRDGGGQDLYDDGYARGAAFDPDQAVAYALGEPEPIVPDSERSDPAVGLTRRETQVAELVGRGLSNKEIAATLVISQRTAEGHVQRILTKFGFTSRAQIATWVAEQRTPAAG